MLGTRFAFTDRVKRTVSEDAQNLTFDGKCLLGGREFSITVKLSDANRWINGESIQDCFPELTAGEREILLSGIDENKFDELFPEDEE